MRFDLRVSVLLCVGGGSAGGGTAVDDEVKDDSEISCNEVENILKLQSSFFKSWVHF